MTRRLIAVTLCTFAIAGCGTASDAVTFTAPPGYKAEASLGPFAQIWTGADSNTLMLMAIPKQVDLSKPIQESPVGNATIVGDKSITICGDQPARFGDMRGQGISVTIGGSPSPSAAKGRPQNIEFVLTIVNGKTYMAIYARPFGAPPDRAAEAAIHNVCPRPQ